MDPDRTKRVKEARDEAKKEIEAYKNKKDDEFKKFEAEVCNTMCPAVLLRYGDCLIDSGICILNFTNKVLQHTRGNKKAEEDASRDAEAQIKSIKEAGKQGQDKVVADLLKAVFDVKPVVPKRIEMPS
jgi:V-type H+-transporting ATPase subunit G